jgi:hypothetical protein
MKVAIIVVAAMLTVTQTIAQSPTTQVAAARADHVGATGALFKEIRASDMTLVKSALAAGANVNGRSEEGDTPLMYAAVYSTAECVRTRSWVVSSRMEWPPEPIRTPLTSGAVLPSCVPCGISRKCASSSSMAQRSMPAQHAASLRS